MDWQTLEAAVDTAVFATWQEAVRLSFLKNGVVDPVRPPRDIKAILHHPGLDGALTLGGGMLTSVAASRHYLVIERAKYPGLIIRAQDRVRATERPGMPWYEVSKVNDRHSGIIILELGEA
ncbi:hypothetical protein LJR030_000516 [Rhizobium sp. LjRoot30]|uniref:hypothetical protein n=1 Tax=Rhizobium sp. LjRoot30 TaxID=3342320 RepID=UPI003ED12336